MMSTASRSAAQCSVKRLTRHPEAVDTTRDGLSQRRRNNGSDLRLEARDESAVRADDEVANKA